MILYIYPTTLSHQNALLDFEWILAHPLQTPASHAMKLDPDCFASPDFLIFYAVADPGPRSLDCPRTFSGFAVCYTCHSSAVQ